MLILFLDRKLEWFFFFIFFCEISTYKAEQNVHKSQIKNFLLIKQVLIVAIWKVTYLKGFIVNLTALVACIYGNKKSSDVN